MSYVLSPRELEVLKVYVAEGANKRVAHVLGISEQTVKNHLTNIYLKLDAPGIIAAYKALGWLRIPE